MSSFSVTTPDADVPLLTGEFIEERRRFYRQARDAVHQVLWYLGVLAPTNRAEVNEQLTQAAPWRVHQAIILLESINVNPVTLGEAETRRWQSVIHALEAIVPKGPPTPESAPTVQLGLVRQAMRVCEEYLEHSLSLYSREPVFRALPGPSRFVAGLWHWVPTTIRWLGRHRAGFTCFAAVLWTSFYLPQLSGLLEEAIWPTLGIALCLLFFSFGTAMLGHLALRDDFVDASDIFGPSHRAFRYQAVPPPRSMRRYGSGDPILRVITRANLRRVIWSNVGLAVTGLLALALDHAFPGQLVLTIFGALAVFYVAVGVAKGLDFWVFIDGRPIRAFALVVVVSLALVLDRLDGLPTAIRIMVGLAVFCCVVWAMAKHRQDAATSEAAAAMVVLFALGALYGALALHQRRSEIWIDQGKSALGVERVETTSWPRSDEEGPVVLMVASGGGSRSAIYTAHALEQLHNELPEVACSLEAIASVSGGSLTNAAYTKMRWFAEEDICGDASSHELAGLVSAVDNDFILPTMSATLRFESRGKTLQGAWESAPVDLGDKTIEDIAAAWKAGKRTGPLPLMQTVNLERHAVIMSPLVAEAFTNPNLRDSARQASMYAGESDPTWVYYRDAMYGLDELLQHRPTRLSEAVRASANFPFGFPLVQIRPTRGTVYSPVEERRQEDDHTLMFLTDGGALSNSGMLPMFQLIRNHEKELARRGVLLIVVEASYMDEFEEPGRFSGVEAVIDDRAPIGQALHRAMFDFLDARLGDRFAMVQLDLAASERHNIETTWALSRARVRDLERLFRDDWGDLESGVGKASEIERAFSQVGRAARACAHAEGEAEAEVECFGRDGARAATERPPIH